ncbi:hemolysin III family protein, partial [Propionibacterium freudenreichii]|nr:hemolysin III family protein [Propionibacterium freudenreichii]
MGSQRQGSATRRRTARPSTDGAGHPAGAERSDT